MSFFRLPLFFEFLFFRSTDGTFRKRNEERKKKGRKKENLPELLSLSLSLTSASPRPGPLRALPLSRL